MNERIRELLVEAGVINNNFNPMAYEQWYLDSLEKFAELIVAEMHRKVIASILITDVLMEEKGQKPTSEDYIRAINKDFGVKE